MICTVDPADEQLFPIIGGGAYLVHVGIPHVTNPIAVDMSLPSGIDGINNLNALSDWHIRNNKNNQQGYE